MEIEIRKNYTPIGLDIQIDVILFTDDCVIRDSILTYDNEGLGIIYSVLHKTKVTHYKDEGNSYTKFLYAQAIFDEEIEC